MIINDDVFNVLPTLNDEEYNLIYSDIPYNLGSTYEIDKNNKVKYSKKIDFMNKWDGLSEEQLDILFKEFYRVLKKGGFCVLFCQDRQTFPFQYYALKNRFKISFQKIYTYSISNFPKALDVSKQLRDNTLNIKYNGYKYSISPLKQVLEEILVFRKDTKNSIGQDILDYEVKKNVSPSVLNINDNMVGVEKVYTHNRGKNTAFPKQVCMKSIEETNRIKRQDLIDNSYREGRYPSQLYLVDGFNYTREQIEDYFENNKLNEAGKNIFFNVGIDIDVLNYMTKDKAIEYICNYLDKFKVSNILDEQSGNSKYWKPHKLKSNTNKYEGYGSSFSKREGEMVGFGDSGGCSRILHKCLYELEEFNYVVFYQKPNRKEREAGCDEFVKKNKDYDGRSGMVNSKTRIDETELKEVICRNNHPTLKSIILNKKLLNLFILPDKNNYKILNPFSGVNSEYIGMLANTIKEENITAIEINKDYVDIGKVRVDFWKDVDFSEYEKNKKIKINKTVNTNKLFKFN